MGFVSSHLSRRSLQFVHPFRDFWVPRRVFRCRAVRSVAAVAALHETSSLFDDPVIFVVKVIYAELLQNPAQILLI